LSLHHRRLSLGQGASLCLFGILFGLAFLSLAPRAGSLLASFLFLLVAWFCLWFFSHDLAHHVVGRIVGVGFRYYFLGRPAITKLKLPVVSGLSGKVPVLGLKIDMSSLGSVSSARVRAMYVSGAVFSMFLPLLVLPTAYTVNSIVEVVFTLLTLANILFTVYFSSRVGDLYRAQMVRSASR